MQIELTEAELEKYSRQLILRGWSSELQLQLKSITVSIPFQFKILRRYLLAAGFAEQNILSVETSLDGSYPAEPLSRQSAGVDYLVEKIDTRAAETSAAADLSTITVAITHKNDTQTITLPYPGIITECWIAALIISHQRTVNKEIFPVATMLFA